MFRFSLCWLGSVAKQWKETGFQIDTVDKERIFIIMATVNYLFMAPWFLV